MTETPDTINDDFEEITDTPDIDPDVTVVTVRGEKQVGFKGLKHISMSETEKDEIHETYDDIIIALDDIKDAYSGVDRAWHVGRIINEHNVTENSDMQLTELGAFNTIDDMYARRLFYARSIYGFWPDKRYDTRHSVTALGELASRATNGGWKDTAKNGYQRILHHNEELLKNDVLTWYTLQSEYDTPSITDIVTEASKHHDTGKSLSNAVRRITLLLDRSLESVPKQELKTALKTSISSE